MKKVTTLRELRRQRTSDPAVGPSRTVKDEIRQNLLSKLHRREPLFPRILGYDETVLPHLTNAILSRHNIVLLGLRGQAKSRILRSLTGLLDEYVPYVEDCEIHDDPFAPVCAACRRRLDQMGDQLPVAWWPRDQRYVEKLATPDVTIADIIGDIDPIKAAKGGLQLSNELTVHFGLVPRAHRGIFALNELPDLAPKIQVGLLNILQEGDVQIKGYPVRLPLDLMMVFTANPEDYTARGKIITPLKDRIGSEVKTHYPETVKLGMEITAQEAWLDRGPTMPLRILPVIRETVEEIAFQARRDQRVDKRSGVSQRLSISCLENVVSNAERRALINHESRIVPRIQDLYCAIPSITGKLELEYEGEQRGPEQVARDLIRSAVGTVFNRRATHLDFQAVVDWFEQGHSLKLGADATAATCQQELGRVPTLCERASALSESDGISDETIPVLAEFLLEGLCTQKKISRSEELGFHRAEQKSWREVDLDDRRTPRRRVN